MLEIDGSLGEGGGQVLRTALTLSALTGQPFHLTRIRAGRKNPGLAPQHITSALAAAKVCRAEIHGAHERSQELWFTPGHEPRAGEYIFDVREQSKGGSAGAVGLVFQTILLPLLAAEGASHVTLRGGSHVDWSPSFHYLRDVYLPALRTMGAACDVQLRAWGFYPVGGGEMAATIEGRSGKEEGGSGQRFFLLDFPFRATERGTFRAVAGHAVAANLPAHIPQRISGRAMNLLKGEGLRTDITPERVRAEGPGAGLFLAAKYEHITAGFTSLGRQGKPSEQVADEACLDLLTFHRHEHAAVDMHLADQLLLPCALAPGRSEYTTCRVTRHLLTNAEVIRMFLPAQIVIEGEENQPGRVSVET